MRFRYMIAGCLALISLALLISGCSSSEKKDSLLTYGKSDTEEKSKIDGFSEKNTESEARPAEQTTTTTVKAATGDTTTAGKKQYAVIETNKGKIVFELYPDSAPNTVDNFMKLSNKGYYNGIKWHRVEPGFVIQGGDPNSKDADPANDGAGGPGYSINAEFNDRKHVLGTVAMARTQDPNSAGSQFYICLGSAPHLDGQYTVFGQVTEGINVVQSTQQYDVMNRVYIVTK